MALWAMPNDVCVGASALAESDSVCGQPIMTSISVQLYRPDSPPDSLRYGEDRIAQRLAYPSPVIQPGRIPCRIHEDA